MSILRNLFIGIYVVLFVLSVTSASYARALPSRPILWPTRDVGWTQFRGTNERSGFNLKERIVKSPVIFNDKLFVCAWDGNVYALNPNNGQILWKTYVSGQSRAYRASPLVVNNRFIVATYEQTMSYVNVLNLTTGAIESSTALPGTVYSSAVQIAFNRIAIVVSQASGDSLMQAYEIGAEGNLQFVWEKQLDADSWSTPLVVNGKIFHRTGNWQTKPGREEAFLYIVEAVSG